MASEKTDLDKLCDILETMSNLRWTVDKFLDVVTEHRDHWRVKKAFGEFKSFAYDKAIARNKGVVNDQEWDRLFDPHGLDAAARLLRRELKALASTACFGTFSIKEGVGSITFLDKFVETMCSTTPKWISLLQKASFPMKGSDNGIPYHRYVVMLSMLCNNMHRNRSDNFLAIVGLYLFQTGCRRQSINLFNSLGLSRTFTAIREPIRELRREAKRKLLEAGSNPCTVVAYDNFVYLAGERVERFTRDKREYQCPSTAIVVDGQAMPKGGLKLDMWRPAMTPMRSVYVLKGLERDVLFRHIKLFFVENAVKAVLGSMDARLADRWVVPEPQDERVEMKQSKYLPLQPIMKDQGYIENNRFILENIYTAQLGVSKDDNQFNDGIRLVYGDLLTVRRMLAIKRRSSGLTTEKEKGSYDSLRWLLPGLGLWHLRYNLLQLLRRVHWGGSVPPDPSALQYIANRLDHNRQAKFNNFEMQEKLQFHSYCTRIVAILLERMQQQQQQKQKQTDECCIDWVLSHTSEEWKSQLEYVVDRVHPDPTTHRRHPVDEIWMNHVRFCRHFEAYQLLSYAIKQADLGLLRRALQECCVMFQSKTGGKHAYGRELVRQLHLTASPAASKALQDAVLVNCLVNVSGNTGESIEVDRLMEMHNFNLNALFKDRASGSTFNDDDLLAECSLTVPYFSTFQTSVERVFGSPVLHPYRQPGKDTPREILDVARDMASDSLVNGSGVRVDGQRFTRHVAVDLFDDGLSSLSENVANYNARLHEDGTLDGDADDDEDDCEEYEHAPASATAGMAEVCGNLI